MLSFKLMLKKCLNQSAKRGYTKTTMCVNERNTYLRSENVQTIGSKTISNITQYDRFRITSPFNLNIHPLSATNYPQMNKVFITLYGNSNLGFSKQEWSEMFEFKIDYDENESILNIQNLFTDKGFEKIVKQYAQTIECHLEVPFQSGISVNCLTNNNVNIENLETKDVFVNTKKGECLLKNLKANSIIVHSESGNIKCVGSVHANADLCTKNCGSITANKILGSFIKLSTEANDIHVKSLYTTNFNIKSKTSNITIENAKGNGFVSNKDGKININSMDGQINVKSDDGSAHVLFSSMENSSSISTKTGDVFVSFMENMNSSIELQCKKFSGHDDILSKLKVEKSNGLTIAKGILIPDKAHDTTSLLINAPKGKVRMDLRDWFSTLKFKAPN